MEQVRLPSHAFRLWRDSGALAVLIPPLGAISDVQLESLDHLRIPGLPGRPQRKIARLIGLFAAAGPRILHETLKALRFSNADVKWITSVVTAWNELSEVMTTTLTDARGPADVDLRRWAAIAGRTRLASVLRLAAARWAAERDAGLAAPERKSVASAYRRAVRTAYRDPIEVGDLAVNGRDLEKMGMSGPLVGRTLRKLLELVINDPAANSRTGLLDTAAQLVDELRSGTGEPWLT